MKRSTLMWIALGIAVVIVVGAYAAISMNQSHSNSIGVVNIGYFANINHAPAILGISSGTFQDALGPSTTIKTTLFTSGTPEMTALVAGQIDIAFVGPDPAVNAYIQGGDSGLQIVAGVASGGAVFVVQGNSGITPGDAKELAGTTLAAPGVGNTQDIALRYYLKENGLNAGPGGNVTVEDTPNSNIVALFAKGSITGAWVPEPYGEVLIQQYGGKLFLDESSLWPNGAFSTTELVVRTAFLQAHPDVVKEIVSGVVTEISWINAHPSQALTDLNSSIFALTNQGYSSSILSAALARMTFTYDPLETSVAAQAQHAYAVGDLQQDPTLTVLSGVYNLSMLNEVLTSQGLPTVVS